MDEIHRFSKAQQDIFLPAVEKGDYTFIGATTENPSFRINSSLISRCKLIVLDKFCPDSIFDILKRAAIIKSEQVFISDELINIIGKVADGGLFLNLN